jgi:release factor glutamine methyltransferase
MNTNSSQTSETWLIEATNKLSQAGIHTARLDCLIMLEDAVGKDRSWLLAHPEFIVQGAALSKLEKRITRRAKHEPLAYIRGKSEFYGREFIISSDTLQPRPESETMIDLLKKLIHIPQNPPLLQVGSVTDGGNVKGLIIIIDVGTGSGCLGITAKLEFPDMSVIATDINAECIKIAKQNAKRLDVDVKFFQGDLLLPIQSLEFTFQDSIVMANLPYVPDGHTINKAAMFEPKIAIFGGSDGLDLYRRLFGQIAKSLHQPKYILTESLPFQHKELEQIAISSGYTQMQTEDFIQIFSLF